jgi:hypothetical protein
MVNKGVFNLDLNEESEFADVTSVGSRFHTRGAATRKARSPIVLRQDRGTISNAEDAERRRSLDDTAATGTRPLFTD